MMTIVIVASANPYQERTPSAELGRYQSFADLDSISIITYYSVFSSCQGFQININ
jgi:hypothetical protein